MSADLLKWKYCWFDLWHKEEEGKRQSGRNVDKGKQLWRGFQLCFFVSVRLQKQTVSITVHCGLRQSCLTTEKPELS